VDLKKEKFIGRAAAAEEKESGGALRLLAFTVDATDADALGDEPIWHEGRVVGWVTSGAFGHRVGASLALGYVPAVVAGARSGFEIEIIGERHAAVPLTGAAFDPSGGLMRA
jgi:dimethylglycine dehydrogenase